MLGDVTSTRHFSVTVNSDVSTPYIIGGQLAGATPERFWHSQRRGETNITDGNIHERSALQTNKDEADVS
jgi:hypothetical protein